MNVSHVVHDFAAVSREKPLHLAIGMFDGVHLGHQAVIESAISNARQSHAKAGVLTFHPHPSKLFRPDSATRLIMDVRVKTEVLKEIGVDVIINKEFTKDFASLVAEGFVGHLKEQLPNLAAIYVGENFRFGKGRLGDVSLMIQTAKNLGIEVYSADRIKHNGEPISSTRIRACLEEGLLVEANRLLGRRYFCEGVVAEGQKIGRKIGFPTLNIPYVPELRPKYGVYAVTLVKEDSGERFHGVANYGVRPTVSPDSDPVLEVHLFQPVTFGAGTAVKVEWKYFIRPEQKFNGLEELKEQISKDVEKAKAVS